ncbi:uncharacterized protein LOC143586266 [Bidens hawaiensis]|uniref:uncharacterized protein LOC143586266 n=1 Tax=Bidens hawaiensis TaxID=980011 RepID=UPI004049596D
MGPFPNSHDNLYILVAIDYVSKWVEVIATMTNDHTVVCNFKQIRTDRKDWSTKLTDTLWDYRTAYKTPIETTPYRLVYEKDCHLPVDIAQRAYWATKQVNMSYDDASKVRKLSLCEIEELRDEAYDFASTYKLKMKKVHDAKIRLKKIEVGQKVWLYNTIMKLFLDKLKSKWMGPYLIVRVGIMVNSKLKTLTTM